jgi:endonuclease YncB( thermonuclease family)
VLLVSDPSQALKDRYGRLLRYISKHGKDVNRAQVNSGHATVYVYHHRPFRRVESYRRAQRSAKAHNLGIWKHCR